ncbi:hypothetical protein [Streptomyces albipurpureus]|uniref:Integral membrane protein n=1 Tax=Streptomyces albipurpureus TaxID=2897419 RepID=A0ABT0UTW4_9ACTN|nr:hypothetical protein [Streptomyces sp. CWNU-1]MCM2391419.1 hypothetical protein [Streptomyces sp. CWNU-1]
MSSLRPSPPLPPLSGVFAEMGPRLLRAAVFTALCVVLAATGHALASGSTVPPWTLAVGFAVVFALVMPFTGRVRALPWVAGGMGVGQFALHLLFGVGQHQLRLTPAADDILVKMAAKLVCGGGASSLSPTDAHRIVTTAGLTPPTHGGSAHVVESTVGQPALLPSLAMLLAHLLTAVVTGWLLRHGDLALTRLGEHSAATAPEMARLAWLRPLRAALALVRALCTGLVADAELSVRPQRTGDDPHPAITAETLQHAVIRRGPPARFVLTA